MLSLSSVEGEYSALTLQITVTYVLYVCTVITYSKGKDQPTKVANPARGELSRENVFPCPHSRLTIWSRETGSAVPSRVSQRNSIILRLNLEYSLQFYQPQR